MSLCDYEQWLLECLSSRWILAGRRNRSLFFSFTAGAAGAQRSAVVNLSTAGTEFDEGMCSVSARSNAKWDCVGVDMGVESSSSDPYVSAIFCLATWEWKEEDNNAGSDDEGRIVSSRL